MGQAPGAGKEPVAPARPTQSERTAGHNSVRPHLFILQMKTKGLASKSVVAFSEDEVAFLTESRLARVGTASSDGQPHVVPVVYEFDGAAFYFTGRNLEKSLKFRNLAENEKVALVVDELVTVCPWRPRGLEIRGVAELGSEGGRAYVRVTPAVKRSWGF